ncbi:MAG: nuclear transport factor 2 family protein [Rhodothermales bacterium]|nr:nuclear transport factor 2 family protein [Rhodothermales bacterium]MBO6778516.1 nuclear transport factor 2 family protein [Rhodothermales bacterium]
MPHRLLLLSVLLTGAGCSAPQSPDSAEAQTVRAFTQAFNEHDVAAMALFLHEDAHWIYLMDDSLYTEAESREAITTSMAGYFEAYSDVNSSLESVHSLGPFVTAVERVSWNGGQNAQSATVVYELENDLIRRVWYHDAVR